MIWLQLCIGLGDSSENLRKEIIVSEIDRASLLSFLLG